MRRGGAEGRRQWGLQGSMRGAGRGEGRGISGDAGDAAGGEVRGGGVGRYVRAAAWREQRAAACCIYMAFTNLHVITLATQWLHQVEANWRVE